MRFEIIRASAPWGDKPAAPPVEGAVLVDGEWFIDLDSLDDLMALYATAKADLIVSPGSIWIYDDYMG